MTWAIAAPLTPKRNKKMNIGSNMIFATSPTTALNLQVKRTSYHSEVSIYQYMYSISLGTTISMMILQNVKSAADAHVS